MQAGDFAQRFTIKATISYALENIPVLVTEPSVEQTIVSLRSLLDKLEALITIRRRGERLFSRPQ